ncbi:hypothetical protein [Pseudodesulfovibrio sp. zrk46]|uniref:hypothetical protein n=1 Tax=Pseudodesulfovibrio sp. zrk46 TaxID=2725288 RepID=UPI001449BB8D|nr:hypothetical protein [Pseudodesulfovibrio sp. zrk46]QJB55931.1 hypothetical protein HFN16_05685 [Pseudodesulfovibrio sp. zrk46]
MDIFDCLEKSWGSPVVARSEVGKFSGGMLCPKTLANLDCLGEGPERRMRLGRKVGYEVRALVGWMRARASEGALKADISQEAIDE